jgi:hypothetical protein
VHYHRVFSLIGLATAVIIFIITSVTSAQSPAAKAAPLIVGTWKLNLEKSGLRNASPQLLQIRQYKLRDDGYLVGLAITVNGQGNPTFLQFTARSDGRDYPEYTDDLLADLLATGKQTTRTYAERIIDDYTTEWIDKENGRVTGQGTKTISKDGKTMTIDGGGPQPRVFDRQ